MFFKRKNQLSSSLKLNIERFGQGDREMLPLVFGVLGESSPAHQRQAAMFFENLLTVMTPQQLLLAERAMRRRSWKSPLWNQGRGAVKSFLTDEMTIGQKRAVLVFSSFHPDGFIREEAVTWLTGFQGTLPYVILRLTDWVPQVRLAASSSAQQLLVGASEEEILEAIPWIERIRRKKQAAPGTKLDLVIAEIGKSHAQLIIRELQSKDPSVKRFSLDLLLNEPDKNEVRLKSFLLTERDLGLKKKTFDALLTAGADLIETATELLTDRQPRMRLLAMRYLLASEKGLPIDCALMMVLDQKEEIRSLARQEQAKEQPETDFGLFYKAHLHEKPAAAVAGLGETGSPEDTKVIEPYLDEGKGKVMRAAMTALMRLDALKYHKVITDQLQSDEIGTAKRAKALLEQYDLIDHEQILRILKSSRQWYTLVLCAQLLYQTGKWQRLIHSLQLLDIAGQDLQRTGSEQMRRWIRSFNKSMIAPTPEQRSEIRLLLQEKQAMIEKDLLREIHFRLP